MVILVLLIRSYINISVVKNPIPLRRLVYLTYTISRQIKLGIFIYLDVFFVHVKLPHGCSAEHELRGMQVELI